MKKIVFLLLALYFWVSYNIVSVINNLSGAVTIIGDTVILRRGCIALELRAASRTSTMQAYDREITDPTTRDMYVTDLTATLGCFAYDVNLAKFFDRNTAVVIKTFDGYWRYYMVRYDIHRGFYATAEESRHITDLLRYKQNFQDLWTNRYYFAYFL